MDPSNNFAAAYNLISQRGSSSASTSFSHLRPPPKQNVASPVNRGLVASANGSAAGPSVTTPQRVNAQSRGRQASASPDLFATSSRGGSPDSSGSQEDSIQQFNRFISNKIQLSPDPEDDSDSNESARPAFNNSGPLFFADNDDEDPLPGRLSASNIPSGYADSPSLHRTSAPSSRATLAMNHQAAQGSFPKSNGRLLQFQADDEDDDEELWGGSVSPIASRPASTKATRSKESRSAASSRASANKQVASRRLARHDPPDPSAPFWIEIPPLSEKVRRLYSFAERPAPPLRSQRAAAVGAEMKNKKIAELSSKPLVIEERDEDDEDDGEDETRSRWFDPDKRKKSIAQKKRRADPSQRKERAQIRLSQRQQASDSDDSSSSASWERLKIDLSKFKTVPTRKWGTPEPDDASQGLRAAPKSTESTPTAPAAPSPRKTAAPMKKKKSPEPDPKSYEAIFLAPSTSEEDADEPPPSKVTKPSISVDKGKQKAVERTNNTATRREPPSFRSNRAEPSASAARRRAINEESDDEFVPLAQDPEDASPVATNVRQTTNGAGPSAKTKAAPAAKAKTVPAIPSVGPNGQRIFPKPPVAPLPDFRLKLVNMPAPTGMILPQSAYDKEDGRRKKTAGPNGKASTSNKKGPSTTAGQKRAARSRSNTPPQDRRRHRRAASDSDDYEVQAVSSARDPHRTPQSGSRPKARAFNSADRRGRSTSFSPPRRSAGSNRRQRNQSVTPSSESEYERSRGKQKAVDRRRSGGGSAAKSKAGPLSKTGASQSRSKDGPAPRSFVMPDSQPPPRKKLKPMTLNRDKILGRSDGGRTRENGEGRAPQSRESRFTQSGGMDYGDADDDSDIQSDRGRRREFSRSPSIIRTRRQAQEEGSDTEMTRRRAPKNLRSNLNEQAWVYTSGTHKREVYRDDLNKLKKARRVKGKGTRRGAAHNDSEDSESDEMAASTGESSLSSESKMKNKAPLLDFLVDDEDQPVNTLGRRVPLKLSQSSRKPGESSRSSQKDRSRRREYDSDDDRGDRRDRRRDDDRSHRRQDDRRHRRDRDDDGGGREMQPSDYIRMEMEREATQREDIAMPLGEAYWWEVVWLVLGLFGHQLPPEDFRIVTHARGMIAKRMADGRRALQTMAIRKNFQWYLKTYPQMQRYILTNDELNERIDSHGYGCGMCPRKKQKPESRILFYGKPYGPELTPRQKDEISSSDCNTDQSKDYKKHFFDVLPNAGRGKKNYWAFYVGSKCAARAQLLHKVMHWEVKAQERVRANVVDISEEEGWYDLPLDDLLKKIEVFATGYADEFQRNCESVRTNAMDFDRSEA
ncbi:hypothetical protein OC845_000138 [Tilletia horrida]|nr:hypothetical protein OC845_000138 [Tilletia horrida]